MKVQYQWDETLTRLARELADVFSTDLAVPNEVAARHHLRLGAAPISETALGHWQALFTAAIGATKPTRSVILDVLMDVAESYPVVRDLALSAVRRYDNATSQCYELCRRLGESLPAFTRVRHVSLTELGRIERHLRALHDLRAAQLHRHRQLDTTELQRDSLFGDSLDSLKRLLDPALAALHVYQEFLHRISEERDSDWISAFGGRSIREEAVRVKQELAQRIEALSNFPFDLESHEM